MPPVLLGKFWRLVREWGPPFRHRYVVTDGVFHVCGGVFDDGRDALARHGITMVYCQGMGREASWAHVVERLRRGRPTALLLDDYYLPIYPTFYQQHHLSHVYVLNGFDPSTGTVTILNSRQSLEVWPTPLEAFMQSWATEEFEWYDLLVPETIPPYTAGDLRDDLARSVAEMLPPHPGEHWTKGVPAIRRLAADLDAYPDRYDPAALKAILEDGFHQMPGIREQRAIHGTALRLIGAQLGAEALAGIGRAVEDLGKAWGTVRNWLVKAGETDPRTGVAGLTRKLRQVADAEERALLALRDVLDAPRQPTGRPVDVRLPAPAPSG